MNIKAVLGILIGIGTLFIGVGVYMVTQSSSSSPSATSSDTPVKPARRIIDFPATRIGWHEIGTGSFSVTVKGKINYGGADRTVTTDSMTNPADTTALAPRIPFGVLVAKIGEEGTVFQLGSFRDFNTSERVYVAVNDSYYGDNTGSYQIEIK